MTKPGVSYTGVPQHLAALRTRLANVSRDSKVPQQRSEVLIASVVATQLVSDAVVKGGIALKLHACTDVPADGTNDRAHDLVDILLLCELDQPEVGDIGRVARQVFASRRAHSWPPVVIAHSGWAERYADATAGLDMPDLVTAVRLVNDLITAADAANEDG